MTTCVLSLGLPYRRLLAAADANGEVDVGRLSDFDRDGAVDTWADRHRFFVVRQGNRLFAVDAICTHETYPLKAQNDRSRLYCSKHKSSFELNGRVQSGKPKKPLPHLAIRQTDAGRVIVDPGRRFDEPQWDDPQARIILAQPAAPVPHTISGPSAA